MVLALGAVIAGFVNGFAGFGTALVASGFWFLVLPADVVPPLIIISALAGQVVGLIRLSGQMKWGRSAHLVSGGLVGVPLGAALLGYLNPQAVKAAIGIFLVIYAALQFRGLPDLIRNDHKDGRADRFVGFFGGILGGFAGLSGPVPLVWLQLNKLSPIAQRERYQPFNLIILGFAAIMLVFFGKLDRTLMIYGAVAVPCSMVGAAIGVRAFIGVSAATFNNVVLGLLLLSGGIIVVQSAAF
ncbi:sulfite exporter TauE/SafE family protein [Yoonia sp. BS5-3]|uniref:Probable membrane transporter protein n=1 Tax=Yoonia phaeophyticola TaxID=3137369 RepID=A0ABZ2VA46_9RHOB